MQKTKIRGTFKKFLRFYIYVYILLNFLFIYLLYHGFIKKKMFKFRKLLKSPPIYNLKKRNEITNKTENK